MCPNPNPTAAEQPRKAVALRYDERASSAPRIVARGVGEVAQQILETAEAHGIPVESDADLVELLSGCEMAAEIPMELYEAVAELLSWLYGINGAMKG